jgi:urease accessory protein
MFDSEPPDERAYAKPPQRLARADSEVRIAFAAGAKGTFAHDVLERGSFRVRFPRGGGCDGVLLNTGGGITGGDRLRVELGVAPGADAVVTSQAAEKLYRSDGQPARIAMQARLAAGARLDWLPQESILFDHADVERTIDVEMAEDAQLTMLEVLVLGRAAHGERLTSARWADRWRVSRGGRLVLAENVRLAGDVAALMRRPATGDGAVCVATLAHIAPGAMSRLDRVRAALAGAGGQLAASAWDGMLVARFAAADLIDVRRHIMAAVTEITGRAMPRAWSC